MINAINGYDIIGNSLKSQKLNDEIEKFLSSGNEVKVLGGSFVKKIKPVFNPSMMKRDDRKVQKRPSRAGYAERLKHQQAVLTDYLNWYTKPNKWKAIVDNADIKVSQSHFRSIIEGCGTISNQEKWDAIEKSIAKIKKDMGVE